MRKHYLKNLFFMMSFLVTLPMMAQTQLQKEQITSRYDNQKIQQLKIQFSERTTAQKQNAQQIARANNWPLIVKENGTYAELQKVVDGKPIYYTTFNVDAAKSTRADHLNSGGSLGLNLDGQNMTAHVWDGGLARTSHQEYDGAGGNNRFSIGDGTTTLHYHSAHVTGTIIASGVQANAKGMAPQASAVGYDWNSDTAEGTAAAGNGMLISNHSYGYIASGIPDQWFGAYGQDASDWDQIMFNAPNYLMVVAAGNDGNDNSSNAAPLSGNSSYDKLSGHATAKNNMVVANAQDANIDANGNLVSVSINSGSSEGPTDDFRIKPDITGNGTQLYSTYESSNTAYNSITGTSMASPNVAGTLLILQQHTNNVNGSFMRAATLKGLALHTADDAGANGPDAIYGWGLLNGKSAAEAITNNGNESIIDELTLISGQSYQITVDSDGINDLMASISWTDRAGTVNSGTNSSTAALVNDLDIRVTKGGTTHNPWRLTGVNSNTQGDNTVDPYERVDVENATGTYTITVTHKGSLTGGSQNYSLIVTGLTGTPVVCNATVPTGLSIDGFGSSTATVSWDAVSGASYDLRYRQTGTSTWTTNAVSGTSTSLSGLASETQYEVQVRSKCPDNSTSAYSSSVNFTTTEVQLNYCTSESTNTNDEFISRVQLGTIDNSSGAQFYSDFTNISTGLTQGQNYTITVTPTWTGTVYNEAYSVWIDYNHDGDFTDSGEQVWTQGNTQATPVSGSFTIPSGTFVGATRMRVSMQYNAIPTSCQTFTYGEVEDYTVNLSGSQADTEAPTTPTNLTASGTTETTTNLLWTASTDNVGVTGYDVYRGSSVIATVSGTSYTATGLTVNTAYTFSVIAKDAAGNESGSSNAVNVTTPDLTAPTVPTSLAASSVTQTTLTLNWTASSDNVGVTGYDVYQGSNNLGNVAGTSANITGLTANTAYTFSVIAKDAAGNESSESNTVNVTTLPTSGGSGCSGGITTFPYNEGFENTLGAWTQSTADDINWTVDANGTPSSGTGPSSASQGTYYVYVEASGNGTGYPDKQAILNSPCFNLSGETEATFSFKYHQYGSTNMGTIDLEASDDDGATWTSIWNSSGNLGNSWQSASVNLAAYVGGSVQLRFNRVTGSTWQADIAIDDVSLTNGGGSGGSGCSGGITSFPYNEGFENTLGAWSQSTADDINWTVDSNGTPSSGTGPSSATEGTFYVYVEASGNGTGYPDKQAILNSPCFDLSSQSSATFSFNYHQYGSSNMGTIDLEASDDDGSSWTSIWNSSGNLGNSWQSASVSLTSYVGGSVQLRFNRVTGSTWQADIAIDNVSLTATGTSGNSTFAENSISNETDLKIFPNPVKQTLNVSLFGFEAKSFQITNMIGQVVLKGTFTETVNVSELEKGMYILQINSEDKTKVKRFIKE